MSRRFFIFCSDITKRYGIYILLTIAFVPALITVVTRAYGPVENYGWNILYYHVGYEAGFGGRKLLASFCHIIFPDFVQLRHIRAMVLAINFLMVALFALFFGNCFKKCKEASFLWMILVFYIIGPFSIVAFMSSGLSVAFTETYQITLTLLWLIIWMKQRGRWPFYIATLLIAVTCCLIHHTFCCTLFPLYVGLFLYDIFGRKGLEIKPFVCYGVICSILLALLILIWKYSTMTIDIDQLNDWFNKHVAVNAYECSREAHNSYYYMTNAENRASMTSFFTWGRRYGELLCSIILLFPLLVVMYYPWIRASHIAPTQLSSWRYRLVWILVTGLTLPIFFIATDYNRWFVCFFFSMFAVTIATLSAGDQLVVGSTKKMLKFFTTHPAVAFALMIYLFGLHTTPFDQKNSEYGLQEAIDIWHFTKGVLGIV